MDGEAIRIDIRCICGYTPVLALVHVEFFQEDDYLRRCNEGAVEVDATRGPQLEFIPGMVIVNGELPGQVFEITWRQIEPASARREEYAISPGIEAGLESGFRDSLGVSTNADVSTIGEIE